MPEFTKVWSIANIALIKLTARLFTVGVLLLSTKSLYSEINKLLKAFTLVRAFLMLATKLHECSVKVLVCLLTRFFNHLVLFKKSGEILKYIRFSLSSMQMELF